MKKMANRFRSISVGLGVLLIVVVVGIVQSGAANSGPEISIYYSPS